MAWIASSLDTPFSAASCPSCACRSGVRDANAVVKSPLYMAFTHVTAASPEPANWPLSAPPELPPIDPPGLVGGGSAPPGRLMFVFMGWMDAPQLLEEEDEELDVLVAEVVLAAVALSSSLLSTTNSTTPAATRTTTTAAMIHGRGLFFGGCP